MTEILLALLSAVTGYLFKSVDAYKNNTAKAKAYKTILEIDFQQNIDILKYHDLTSNPFKSIKYKFWNSYRIQLAEYIPEDAILYGKWLAACQSLIRGVENYPDPQTAVKDTVTEGLNALKTIASRKPQ